MCFPLGALLLMTGPAPPAHGPPWPGVMQIIAFRDILFEESKRTLQFDHVHWQAIYKLLVLQMSTISLKVF